MIKKNLKAATLILSLVLITHCTSLPRKKEPTKAPPGAVQLFNSVQIDLASNNKARALKKLDKVIQSYPDTDLADDALIMRGDINYKNKKFEAAYDNYIAVVKSEIYSPKEVDASYLAAKSLSALGRWDEASLLLNQALKNESIPLELLLSIFELKVDLHRQLGDAVESLRYLVKLSESHTDAQKKEHYRNRATSAIENGLEIKNLEYISNDSDFGFLRPQALYNLGVYHLEDQNFSTARDFFLEITSAYSSGPLAEKSRAHLEQINARRVVDPKSIGAVLPLSGKNRSIGLRELRGLQLGLGIYGPVKSDYRLAVVDSEGSPDVARRAAERLVVEDHVIAIVGSYASKTAPAIASAAHAIGVPSIDLSQKMGVTNIGDSVFRNSISSEMYIKHLVRVAMEEFNLTRFAILYPNDSYGVEYANLFWDEVLRRGGQVNGVQTYPPAEKDFKGQIQRLVGTYYLEDRLDEYRLYLKEWEKKQKKLTDRNRPPEDLLPPIVDFEAIFIPDEASAVGQISQMLVYNDVSGLRLMGTNIWNKQANEFIKRGEASVENSLFVDSHMPSEKELEQTSFYQDYFRAFGQKPTDFEIQAYDTARILKKALDRGASSRQGLAADLRDTKDFQGVIGPISINARREFTRPIVALTVANGQIQKIGPKK